MVHKRHAAPNQCPHCSSAHPLHMLCTSVRLPTASIPSCHHPSSVFGILWFVTRFSACGPPTTLILFPTPAWSLPALPLHLSCCCPACVSLCVQHVGDHQHSNAAAGKDPRGCEAALCAAGPLTPSLCDCSRPGAQEATRVPVASKGGCSERETEWGRYDVELLATQRQFRKDLV